MELEKKSTKRFKKLFREAEVLMESGRRREGANKYLEAVLACPSVWTENRYVAFEEYTTVLEEDAPTKKRHQDAQTPLCQQ